MLARCVSLFLALVLLVSAPAGAVLGQETGSPDEAPASVEVPEMVVPPPPEVVAPAPPEAAPTPAEIAEPPAEAAPSPPPPVSTCGAPANPWGYSYCGGKPVRSPPANLCSVFACIPTFWRQVNGYVIQCRDGLLSHSGGVRGSCSGHGGNLQPLYSPN
jgi:hypothetical protein